MRQLQTNGSSWRFPERGDFWRKVIAILLFELFPLVTLKKKKVNNYRKLFETAGWMAPVSVYENILATRLTFYLKDSHLQAVISAERSWPNLQMSVHGPPQWISIKRLQKNSLVYTGDTEFCHEDANTEQLREILFSSLGLYCQSWTRFLYLSLQKFQRIQRRYEKTYSPSVPGPHYTSGHLF